MAKHTMQDLMLYQALPLDVKIQMTKNRIRGWIEEFGEDGVYVSFSGGKDSTVLLDIVREDYPNVPAVFVDVPTQYPELREFAKTWDNVEILKPKMSFMQICERYGFPLISKEISRCAHDAKKEFERMGLESLDDVTDADIKRFESFATKKLYGVYPHKENGVLTGEYSKTYDRSKYRFMIEANFYCSDQCCAFMKKKPAHEYQRRTGRNPITAQMASESKQRESQWLLQGCNAFDIKFPISNPMAFWTEQDVLLYLKIKDLPICSVYGDIVEDWDSTDDIEGQMTISDLEGWSNMELFDAKRPPLKTTGCDRTGCVLCGFGCHLEKEGEGRFERLKQTHPKFYNLLDVVQNNGVTYREAIEWINEHGNLDIKL